MSLKPSNNYLVPDETARVAQAVYPKGNPYLDLYDVLGTLYEDEDFIDLYPTDGQPALSPVRLGLVLILQFMEGLSDRQAAEAARSRIDWKYLLCLELTDSGFHYSVLSEYRKRLLDKGAEQRLLTRFLELCRAEGLLKERGQQRSDSTHVLGAIRQLNRLELVRESLRQVLNLLAVAAPDWVLMHTDLAWSERYGKGLDAYRLPKSETDQVNLAEGIGQDGLRLLQMLWKDEDNPWLLALPAVVTMRMIWVQNYTWREEGLLRWRTEEERPPSHLGIRSPFDPESRFAIKRSTAWEGYKVHLTETYDQDLPHLVTHVETTSATLPDAAVTEAIHAGLRDKGCLPATHLVDAGYVTADLLVSSQQDYALDLLGPVLPDTGWQARQAKGFAAADFTIHWDRQVATCPAGTDSIHWMPARNNKGQDVIQIKWSKLDCRPCSHQPDCTRSTPPRRSITVLPQHACEALWAARQRQDTDAFTQAYSQRAGIEGTLSQGIRANGMRQARYRGLAKTHLQNLLTAMALNLSRLVRWLDGIPLALTRQSAFARLHASASAC